MAQITPQMVKDLREKTGAGMGDCKSALVEADGDMQAAIEVLRKKGAASVAKRADRVANEGIVTVRTSYDGKIAAIVEVNSETDFVARNEQFENYVAKVADIIFANNPKNIEQLMEMKVGNDTVMGLHNEILAKFSEKIGIKQFIRIESSGYVAGYIHTGSKLGVLIEVSVSNPDEKSKSLIRDIAMQIAAMNPQFIDRSVVTQEQINKEIEIYKELAVNEGKKPEIAERIATGRLEKFFQEQCLIEQTFVKDSSKTVKDVLKQISDETKTEARVLKFIRYNIGEA